MSAEKAKGFHAELQHHVRDWYEGQISYETFGALQRETWNAIGASDPVVEELVLHAVRERLPAPKHAN